MWNWWLAFPTGKWNGSTGTKTSIRFFYCKFSFFWVRKCQAIRIAWQDNRPSVVRLWWSVWTVPYPMYWIHCPSSVRKSYRVIMAYTMSSLRHGTWVCTVNKYYYYQALTQSVQQQTTGRYRNSCCAVLSHLGTMAHWEGVGKVPRYS